MPEARGFGRRRKSSGKAESETPPQNLPQTKRIHQLHLFLAVSLLSVTGLLIYLWVYNEIILTEKGNAGLRKTKEVLLEDNKRLGGNIARLMRADRITSIAEKELNLVTPVPETLVVFIEPRDFSDRSGAK